jgi:hypothetical protein
MLPDACRVLDDAEHLISLKITFVVVKNRLVRPNADLRKFP